MPVLTSVLAVWTSPVVEWIVKRPDGQIVHADYGMTKSETRPWTEETAKKHCASMNERDGGGWQALSRTVTIEVGDWA